MITAQDARSALPGQSVVALQGASRQIYGFTAFPLDAPPSAAGIYIFARPAEAPRCDTLYWEPLFVGETRDMSGAVPAQRSLAARARKLGATHLLVHFCGRGEAARREKAHDLIDALHPALNGLHRAADAA